MNIKYKKNENIEAVEIGNEIGFLNIENGMYHVIDEVAKDIWNLVIESKTIEEVVTLLTQTYSVNGDTCRKDVEIFIEKLLERNIIERV